MVEHLVYTERVVGSKPSPPSFQSRTRASLPPTQLLFGSQTSILRSMPRRERYQLRSLSESFALKKIPISDHCKFVLARTSRTKIKTCDAIISGTRNVGRRMSGSSLSACIDCQSFKPNRSALETTKTMSMRPNVFQLSKTVFAN